MLVAVDGGGAHRPAVCRLERERELVEHREGAADVARDRGRHGLALRERYLLTVPLATPRCRNRVLRSRRGATLPPGGAGVQTPRGLGGKPLGV